VTRTAPLSAALLALTLAAVPAAGQVPDYPSFVLQCRSNFTGAFNLPDAAFFTNNTAAVNDDRQVAMYVSVIAGSDSKSIWFGSDGSGGLVYTSPAGAFLSDASVNGGGRVVFEQVFTAMDGIYFYDDVDASSGFETNLPFGASGWGSPQVNDAGEVGMRADFGSGQAYASYDGVSTAAIHAAEVSLDVTSPYSFLFTPSFNGSREIAGKVRLGANGQVGESQPDEIRVFADDGSSVLIAEDRDSNPASPYDRFDNSVSLTDSGWVAFVATLPGGVRGVYLSDGTTTVEIATEDDLELAEVEFFGPAANDAGLVAFRGRNSAGLRAIFVGDGGELRQVIAEHDLVETDLGTARIDQHDSSPVFGGGVSINAGGDVAFAAGLTPPDDNQVEWGSGVFLAEATLGLIFADGFESGDVGAWSAVVP
jgi:hypothetical protein